MLSAARVKVKLLNASRIRVFNWRLVLVSVNELRTSSIGSAMVRARAARVTVLDLRLNRIVVAMIRAALEPVEDLMLSPIIA